MPIRCCNPCSRWPFPDRRRKRQDRKSTRLNSSHTEIYTLSLHDALPISARRSRMIEGWVTRDANSLLQPLQPLAFSRSSPQEARSEEHTSELQSHRDLHSFPTRRSSDLSTAIADDRGLGYA